jgi:hypothetical protein
VQGAGRRLRYEDLQAQFGLGLKEAATNLGICAATLRSACRRNGIKRWPRRHIAKLSSALNQMGYQGAPVTMPQQRHLGLPRNDSVSSTAQAQAQFQFPLEVLSLGDAEGARLRLQAPLPALSLGSLGGAFPDLPPGGGPPGAGAAAAAALDGLLGGLLPGELGPGDLSLGGKAGDDMDFDTAMLRGG